MERWVGEAATLRGIDLSRRDIDHRLICGGLIFRYKASGALEVVPQLHERSQYPKLAQLVGGIAAGPICRAPNITDDFGAPHQHP